MSNNPLLMGCTSLLLLLLSINAHASPCYDVLTALQQERHLEQVKQTVGEVTTEYRDGPNITLSVSCALGKPNMMISWDGPEPDQQFYDLVGRAGGLVSPRTAAEIVNSSKRCRKQAINDSGEIATVEQRALPLSARHLHVMVVPRLFLCLPSNVSQDLTNALDEKNAQPDALTSLSRQPLQRRITIIYSRIGFSAIPFDEKLRDLGEGNESRNNWLPQRYESSGDKWF